MSRSTRTCWALSSRATVRTTRHTTGLGFTHSTTPSHLCATVKLGLNKEKPKENTLEIYRQFFEDDFITATEVYYTAESTHFIATNSVAEYMKKVETRLDEETRRVQQYLNPTTETELVQKCDRVLIEKHLDTIRSDFQNMLSNDKIEDLTRMYKLLSRINRALDPLKTTFEKHVSQVGKQAIQQVMKTAIKDPQQYVETILKVYKQYNALVIGSFRNDPGFVAALDKACRSFINENAVCKLAKSASKSPELLARFVDSLLKKSAKNPEEQEMEQLLTDVVRVSRLPAFSPPFLVVPLRSFPLTLWISSM